MQRRGQHLCSYGAIPVCTEYIRPHVLGCGAPMARRSLRPQLNQIRTWVRQGRTDAWIAHQLEVTVQQIEAFRRDNDLGENGDPGTDYGDEIDLRAEDDALSAA